jgi:hypothetical protein
MASRLSRIDQADGGDAKTTRSLERQLSCNPNHPPSTDLEHANAQAGQSDTAEARKFGVQDC